MINYLEELEDVLNKYKLCKDDIMIVGSSTITDFGLRVNNDIEFSCNSKSYKKIPLKIRFWLLISDHYNMSENVDLFRQRYINIGIHDSLLFKKSLYTMRYGYKVVKPEIEYCYKIKRNWEKDISDIDKISSSPINNKIDWELVNALTQKKVGIFDRGYERLRIGLGWRLAGIMERIHGENCE